MEQYNVTGMSCAACSARVEKAVSKVPGVTSCSVSLLTNSMGVEGTASSDEIIRAVQDAGYGASLKGASGQQDACFCGRGSTGGSRNTCIKEKTDRIHRLSAGADVFLHGTYDVGMAAACMVRWQPCCYGTGTAPACRNYNGHQPEILYQRI